jgi:hypothetical protein
VEIIRTAGTWGDQGQDLRGTYPALLNACSNVPVKPENISTENPLALTLCWPEEGKEESDHTYGFGRVPLNKM